MYEDASNPQIVLIQEKGIAMINRKENAGHNNRTAVNMRKLLLAGVGVATFSWGAASITSNIEANETYIGNDTYEKLISASGDIRVPRNFRTDYVMLGSWSVAGDADTGGEVGLHVVYSTREAVDAYRTTGEFPDGAVVVKELFSGHTEFLTTGEATRADKQSGYFVMIKDTQNRFPDNPLWGDGWGWAFFGPNETMKTSSTNYQNDCMACHEPAKDTDYLYTDAYPVLKK
jgi:hypothetical protein